MFFITLKVNFKRTNKDKKLQFVLVRHRTDQIYFNNEKVLESKVTERVRVAKV